MTFNLETAPADQGQPNQQQPTDNVGQGADKGITLDELNAILKRDENAQKHIRTLEEENNAMRDNFSTLQEQVELLQSQLRSRETVEKLLKGMNASKDQSSGQENKNQMNTPTTSINPDEINTLVTQRIQGYMKEQQGEANLAKAKQQLNELFKDKADDHVKSIAERNSISYEGALELAKTNPTMFNNVFVSPFKNASNSNTAPTTSTQSTSTVPVQNQEITMEYWNKMRRENSRKFFSADVQKQFHQWFHSNKSK